MFKLPIGKCHVECDIFAVGQFSELEDLKALAFAAQEITVTSY